MPDITFICPSCTKSLVIDSQGAGRMIKCPDCGALVQVPLKPNQHPLNSAKQEAKPSADVQFKCQYCDRALRAPAERSGQACRCPSCGKNATVPALSPAGDWHRTTDDQPRTETRKCPGCGAELAIDDVLCVKCGMNQRTGRKVGQKSNPAEPRAPKPFQNKTKDDSVEPAYKKNPWGLLIFAICLMFVFIGWKIITCPNAQSSPKPSSLSSAGKSETGFNLKWNMARRDICGQIAEKMKDGSAVPQSFVTVYLIPSLVPQSAITPEFEQMNKLLAAKNHLLPLAFPSVPLPPIFRQVPEENGMIKSRDLIDGILRNARSLKDVYQYTMSFLENRNRQIGISKSKVKLQQLESEYSRYDQGLANQSVQLAKSAVENISIQLIVIANYSSLILFTVEKNGEVRFEVNSDGSSSVADPRYISFAEGIQRIRRREPESVIGVETLKGLAIVLSSLNLPASAMESMLSSKLSAAESIRQGECWKQFLDKVKIAEAKTGIDGKFIIKARVGAPCSILAFDCSSRTVVWFKELDLAGENIISNDDIQYLGNN